MEYSDKNLLEGHILPTT